ncbi:hypothetical protein PRUPE_4G280200 [Prunus persica]|uniref:Uncharacterized protein n=1 Tax=Prunus persica TaxID=3760 RepID=A0A251PSE9_PRUPE|nr:hypothetical protein PRUPE_4G280200 [Prunus persica]
MRRCKDRSWILFTEIQMLSSEVQTTCVIIQIQWSKPKMVTGYGLRFNQNPVYGQIVSSGLNLIFYWNMNPHWKFGWHIAIS